MKQKQNIAILSGGFSEEKEVSKVTSSEIAKALNNAGFNTFLVDPADFDSYGKMIQRIKEIAPKVVFNGLHGAEGEDGRIQSLLSLHQIPFTGSNYKACAIAMDKYISSHLARSIGVKTPKHILIKKNDDIDYNDLINKIGFPMSIKPNDSGSSVGISIIKKEDKIKDAIEKAFNFSNKILCEKYIKGKELTVTILNDTALPVVEIKPKNGWYDYDNKYTKGNTIYEVPAKLSKQETSRIQEYALKIFFLFDCKSYARVDFRYDGEDFYFLEVNTLPGMTPLSLTPMAAEEAGYDFTALLMEIINNAVN
jgi:D-alanine-D-alanine ligase